MKVVIKAPPNRARLQVNRLRGNGLWRVRKVKTEIYFQEKHRCLLKVCVTEIVLFERKKKCINGYGKVILTFYGDIKPYVKRMVWVCSRRPLWNQRIFIDVFFYKSQEYIWFMGGCLKKYQD